MADILIKGIGITDYKLEGHTVVEFEDVLNAPVILEASNG